MTNKVFVFKERGFGLWPLDQKRDREFPVTGMPNNQGEGFIDYVLWGDDSKPLGLVEAKRTKRSPKHREQQAKLYADCLEAKFGQRPVIVDVGLLYESPFTDISPTGPDALFTSDQVDRIMQLLEEIKSTALAA